MEQLKQFLLDSTLINNYIIIAVSFITALFIILVLYQGAKLARLDYTNEKLEEAINDEIEHNRELSNKITKKETLLREAQDKLSRLYTSGLQSKEEAKVQPIKKQQPVNSKVKSSGPSTKKESGHKSK